MMPSENGMKKCFKNTLGSQLLLYGTVSIYICADTWYYIEKMQYFIYKVGNNFRLTFRPSGWCYRPLGGLEWHPVIPRKTLTSPIYISFGLLVLVTYSDWVISPLPGVLMSLRFHSYLLYLHCFAIGYHYVII